EAFLRGILNARSSERKGSEEFLQSVMRKHSERTPPRKSPRTTRGNTSTKRIGGIIRLLLLAAAVLVAVVSLWILNSPRREAETVARPKSAPPPIKVEETPRETVKAPEPAPNPAPPTETGRPPELRVQPVAPPEPKPALLPPAPPKEDKEKAPEAK